MDMYAMEKALILAKEKLKDLTGELDPEGIRYTPSDVAGDIAYPCFALAKVFKQSPQKIAEDLSSKIKFNQSEILEKAEPSGGYINFYINRNIFASEVLSDFLRLKDIYGSSDIGENKTVVIDYSSPNIAKPFSIGHLRSTNIGSSLCKILSFLNFDCIGDNHLGDWGTQFGKLIYAYKNWGDRAKIEKDPIKELLKLYVRFHDEAGLKGDEQPEGGDAIPNPIEEEARKYFKQLEDGDSEITALWNWIKDISLNDFQKVYDILGVTFEEVLGESFYNDKMDEVIELSESKNILTTDPEGTKLVKLEEHGIKTPLLLQKKDGASLYATRDLAGIIYRTKRWAPEQILYVVGEEQELYFKQLFKVKDLLGFPVKCEHIQFGLIVMPEGKISTRKGNVIFLEDVLNESQERVKSLVEERDLSPNSKEEIAKVVGIGAVKYHDLSQNRKKTVTFEWDKMLSLDGNSSPYLQYSYSRARSIIRKSGINEFVLDNAIIDYTQSEFDLIKKLAQFPEAVISAGKQYYPHIVATYLFELAQEFSRFYGNVKVIGEEEKVMVQRLLLIDFYSHVMKIGLSLLGIGVVEEM